MDTFQDENIKPATFRTKPSIKRQDHSASESNQKLSSMQRKFLKGGAWEPPADRDNFIGFRPHYIFLYGTLMDPTKLREVLQLESPPTLQDASIVGWRVMMWGQYPALVFKTNNIIHGRAYEVQKESHLERLKYYETEAYKLYGSRILLADGKEVSGKTFIYNGDENFLKEGSFDLKDWQMEQCEKKACS